MIKIPRTDWDTFFMLHAHLSATRSTCDRGPELLFDPGRHGVGAVLVRDKRIIAGGYNGSAPGQPHCCDSEMFYACSLCGHHFEEEEVHQVTGRGWVGYCRPCGVEVQIRKHEGGHMMKDGHCVRTIHSESNALIQCALDGVSPIGATLYATASPCFDCAKLIIRARVGRVVVGEVYESRYGLSQDVTKKLANAGIRIDHLPLKQESFLHGPTF